jgi:AcrR family transcriptional regulator
MVDSSAGRNAEPALTRQRILAVSEDVLRRFGPAKANVADVARALNVSPGSIYRHFPSKAALREAVTRDWLERIHAGLDAIADADGPAPDRLARWITTLFEAKRASAREEPELFETYMSLVAEFGFVEVEHRNELVHQLERIIEAGVRRGELEVADPAIAATAVLSCSARFNHPLLAREWSDPGIDEALVAAVDLIVAGLARGRCRTRTRS